ncbi:MAG: NAD-binding protein [Pleurocapsa sp. SU_196_0]|nr:NAD-binding protein [Pleurocapsa sp. SU_196_0]
MIVGSGYTGVQVTTIMNAFGVRVTLLESAANILPPADADVSRALRDSFERRGGAGHRGHRRGGTHHAGVGGRETRVVHTEWRGAFSGGGSGDARGGLARRPGRGWGWRGLAWRWSAGS